MYKKRLYCQDLERLGLSSQAMWYYLNTDPLAVFVNAHGEYVVEGADECTFDDVEELDGYFAGCAEAIQELDREEEEEEDEGRRKNKKKLQKFWKMY